MGDQPRRGLRVAVRKGGGRPPGFQWGVSFFAEAGKEAAACLNDVQYAHIAKQFQELARSPDPSHPATVDVQPIEDYHELRDKGGVLAKINFRAYFFLDKTAREIVILGVDKKEEDGQTSQAVKIRMRCRLRRYRTEIAAKQRTGVQPVAPKTEG